MSSSYRPPPEDAACPEPGCTGRVRLYRDYGDTSAAYDCSAHPWDADIPHTWYRPHEDPKMARKARSTTGAPTLGVAEARTITHVEGNLRRGRFAVDLAPKTLLCGPPGSGKTAVLNAIKLALLGRADDVAGKDDETRDADLYRHLVAPGERSIEAEVVLSDGARFRYAKEAERAAEGTHLPDVAKPFVVTDFAVVLGASAPTQRKWIGQAVAPYVTDAAVEATRVSLGHPDLPFTADERKLPAAERLGMLADRMDGVKRTADARVREEGKNIDRLAVKAGLPVDPAELADVRARCAALGNAGTATVYNTPGEARGAADAVAAWSAQLATATAAYDAAHAAWAEADAAVTQWSNYVETFPPPPEVDSATRERLTAKRAQIVALVAAIDVARETYTHACPTCTVAHPPAIFQQASAAARQAHMADIEQIDGMLAPPDPHAEHRGNLRSWAAVRNARAATLQEAKAAVTTAHEVIASWQQIAARPIMPPEVEDAQALLERRDDLVRRAELHDQIAAARAASREAAEESAHAARVKAAALEIRDTLSLAAVTHLEDAVSRYLPAGERFKVDIGASYVRFGLERDGVFRSATSGAESARMLAAVGAAVGVGQDLSVAIVPERQFDADTLTATMRALANAPGQIILTSTIRWAGKLPAGWKVVEFSNDAPGGGDKPSEASDTSDDAEPAASPEAPTAAPTAAPPPPAPLPAVPAVTPPPPVSSLDRLAYRRAVADAAGISPHQGAEFDTFCADEQARNTPPLVAASVWKEPGFHGRAVAPVTIDPKHATTWAARGVSNAPIWLRAIDPNDADVEAVGANGPDITRELPEARATWTSTDGQHTASVHTDNSVSYKGPGEITLIWSGSRRFRGPTAEAK